MLTARQDEVLAAVREIGLDGWPVSVREVCVAVGLASPSTAHVHLTALERAGYVKQHPRSAHGGYRAVEA